MVVGAVTKRTPEVKEPLVQTGNEVQKDIKTNTLKKKKSFVGSKHTRLEWDTKTEMKEVYIEVLVMRHESLSQTVYHSRIIKKT